MNQKVRMLAWLRYECAALAENLKNFLASAGRFKAPSGRNQPSAFSLPSLCSFFLSCYDKDVLASWFICGEWQIYSRDETVTLPAVLLESGSLEVFI